MASIFKLLVLAAVTFALIVADLVWLHPISSGLYAVVLFAILIVAFIVYLNILAPNMGSKRHTCYTCGAQGPDDIMYKLPDSHNRRERYLCPDCKI